MPPTKQPDSWITGKPTADHDNLKPIFELTETTKIDTFWFVSGGGTWDFMGGVYTAEDGRWLAKYRFRYYNSADAWDSGDTKNVYQIGPIDAKEETRAKLVAIFTMLTKHMAEELGPDALTVLPVNGGIEKYTAMMAKQPFAHVRVSTAEPDRPQ